MGTKRQLEIDINDEFIVEFNGQKFLIRMTELSMIHGYESRNDVNFRVCGVPSELNVKMSGFQYTEEPVIDIGMY